MTIKLYCKKCNKKLSMLMIKLYTCKCGDIYCREHMFGEHSCSFDYKKCSQEHLKKQMPVVIAEKIIKI